MRGERAAPVRDGLWALQSGTHSLLQSRIITTLLIAVTPYYSQLPYNHALLQSAALQSKIIAVSCPTVTHYYIQLPCSHALLQSAALKSRIIAVSCPAVTHAPSCIVAQQSGSHAASVAARGPLRQTDLGVASAAPARRRPELPNPSGSVQGHPKQGRIWQGHPAI